MDAGKIRDEFDQVARDHPELEKAVFFMRDLILFERKQEEQIPVFLLAPEAKQNLKQVIREGHPASRVYSVPVDTALLKKTFQEIGAILGRHRPEKKQEFGEIMKDALDFEKLLYELHSTGTGGLLYNLRRYEIKRPIFHFILIYSLKPFYRCYARGVKPFINEDEWLRSTCPVCGYGPKMARLMGEGGRRYLVCGLCETVWAYRRLECPYCGAGHEDLSELTVEEVSNYRLHVCNHCRGYIKSLDTRELVEGERILELDDIAGIYLDLVAEREGYVRNPD